MANAKKFQLAYPTGRTIYAIIVRHADDYRINDADGAFASAPADPYITVTENGTLKGLYELSENRAAWADGSYSILFYEQLGGSPALATDWLALLFTFDSKNDAVLSDETVFNLVASVGAAASGGNLFSRLTKKIDELINTNGVIMATVRDIQAKIGKAR